MLFQKSKSLPVTLAMLAALTAFTTATSAADEKVAVPNIKGECVNAQKLIKAAGFKAKRISVHGPIDPDAAEIGCPYRQDPKAGTLVKKGSTVKFREWYEGG